MKSPPPLDAPSIQHALTSLPGWIHRDDALEREFTFPDFSAALAFIVRVGIEAERRDHHPEIRNVYSRVVLRLNTHSAGGRVTSLDVDLAQAIQKRATG